MKLITKQLLQFFTLILNSTVYAQQPKVEPAFELNERPAIIEGMTYNPADSNFYFGESIDFKILIYTKQGKPAGSIDAAKDGMNSVLGMTVSPVAHHLWVCGALNLAGKKTMCVFQYDLKTRRLISRYPDIEGKAQLFNDVCVTEDGSVYTTDTDTKSLYTIDTNKKAASLYLQSDSLRDSNGITAVGNVLYVSTSRGFARVNTVDKSITLTNLDDFTIAGNDGLYYYHHTLIGIQNVFFPVTIGRYFLDKEGKKIVKAEVLSAGHPTFVIPTTGVVVNDDFYFMANNNIGDEAAATGKIKKVSVVKIKLK